jgi:hypothetical protein
MIRDEDGQLTGYVYIDLNATEPVVFFGIFLLLYMV